LRLRYSNFNTGLQTSTIDASPRRSAKLSPHRQRQKKFHQNSRRRKKINFQGK